MFKKLLIIVALVGLSFTGAQAQKYALVDMEYILSNIPAYERANEQLNQTSKKWQAEVEALDNEAKTLYKNYQNEVVFLSAEQKKEREQAIVNKEKEAAELKKKYFAPEGELYKSAAVSSSPFRTKSTMPSSRLPRQKAYRSYSTAPATHPSFLLRRLPTSVTKYFQNSDIPIKIIIFALRIKQITDR